jgi:hypothetical protein
MAEEEIALTEQEERILLEHTLASLRAAEAAAASGSDATVRRHAHELGMKALGAYEAVMQLRGLDPTTHRVELDPTVGTIHVYRSD